jgi:hypothetical protein
MNQAETPQTSSSWRAPRDFVSVATGGKTGSEPGWGPAALEQRRELIRDHLANIALAVRAGLSAMHTITDC